MGSCWVDPYETNVYTREQADGYKDEPFDFTLLRFDVQDFPSNRWGADFECLEALDQFSSRFPNWRNSILLPEPPNDIETIQELKYLVNLKNESRYSLIDEISAHDKYFQAFFLGLLNINSRSHRATYLLLKMAARIGETVMAQKKKWYNRPRPSQLYPPLAPPLDVANHASYPSGHAMIAFMLAFAGADAVQGSLSMRASLVKLAERIGWLREVAGFHYPSDTCAGRMAATQTMELVIQLPVYQKTLEIARAEWAVKN